MVYVFNLFSMEFMVFLQVVNTRRYQDVTMEWKTTDTKFIILQFIIWPFYSLKTQYFQHSNY